MPKGDWFSYVALGLIAGFGLALVLLVALSMRDGPNGPAKNNGSDLGYRQSDDDYVEPFGDITAGEVGELKARERPSHPEYYEEQDRRAQKSVADSTEALVFWTQVSIALGIFGSVAIIWTLIETRRAMSVAQDVSRNESRAYVDVAQLKSDSGGGLVAHCRNCGHTPATFFRLGATGKFVRRGEKRDVVSAKDVSFREWPMIAANDERTARLYIPDWPDQSAWVAAAAKNEIFVIVGIIQYGTIFGETFFSDFIFYREPSRNGYTVPAVSSPIRAYQNISD